MTDDSEAIELQLVGEIDRVLSQRDSGSDARCFLGQEAGRTRTPKIRGNRAPAIRVQT